MRIYTSLGNYLEDKQCLSHTLKVYGSDRPFLVLENGEQLSRDYAFLMKLQPDTYEIGFPLVQIEEYEVDKSICQQVEITTKNGFQKRFTLQDEVLDETQITNDENTIERLKQELKEQCDRKTAETIRLFISLFDQLFGEHKNKPKSSCVLLKIPDYITKLSEENARQPLVIALDRRYELRHNLEKITPKLRSQLNRTAEMMSIARIQEMDAYCLRDYVRRPGNNASEKAGSRQQLMGIQRYQNFDTPENRFLKGFCDLLHLDCREYSQNLEAVSLERAINRFRQEPSVQSIPRTSVFIGKPNYVLQQNPIYRSFYQAYLDYLKRRTEKERLWGYRQGLLVDVVTILFAAALLNLEGSYVPPLRSINVLETPNYGRYLDNSSNSSQFNLDSEKLSLSVQCILQTCVFTFSLIQHHNPKQADLELNIRQQVISPISQRNRPISVCIWIFWYSPTEQMLHAIQSKNEKINVCIYLHDRNTHNDNSHDTPIDPNLIKRIVMLKLPDPIQGSLEESMEFLSHQICQWIGGTV